MSLGSLNQTLQATAGKHLGWQVGCQRPAVPELIRSMKTLLAIVATMMLAGCGPPPPVPKATHIQQVQQAIGRAGGVTNVINESRTLFTRLSQKPDSAPFYGAEDQSFQGLSGITNLGDVFYYSSHAPDRIHVRIHNSHFDTYFIDLLNPDLPEPAGFERIAGNVGFIEPNAPGNSR